VLIEDYEDAVAEKSTPRRQSWRKPVIAAVIAAAVMAGGVALLVSSDPTRTVSGTPVVASSAEVVNYADEVEAQELAAATQAEETFMNSLETTTKQGMQEYFDDPATALFLPVTVFEVNLIRTSATQFEGMARMQMSGYNTHQIPIHVTDDGRGSMWQTDRGALAALLG
jgi:hypothetical protein